MGHAMAGEPGRVDTRRERVRRTGCQHSVSSSLSVALNIDMLDMLFQWALLFGRRSSYPVTTVMPLFSSFKSTNSGRHPHQIWQRQVKHRQIICTCTLHLQLRGDEDPVPSHSSEEDPSWILVPLGNCSSLEKDLTRKHPVPVSSRNSKETQAALRIPGRSPQKLIRTPLGRSTTELCSLGDRWSGQ